MNDLPRHWKDREYHKSPVVLEETWGGPKPCPRRYKHKDYEPSLDALREKHARWLREVRDV